MSTQEDKQTIKKLTKMLVTMIKRYEPKFCRRCGVVLEPNEDDLQHPYDNVSEVCPECPPFSFYDDDEV